MRQRRKPASIQPKVRLPADLHKRLWRTAEKSGRSLNAEIVHRLEESFSQEEITQAVRKAVRAELTQPEGTWRGLIDTEKERSG